LKLTWSVQKNLCALSSPPSHTFYQLHCYCRRLQTVDRLHSSTSTMHWPGLPLHVMRLISPCLPMAVHCETPHLRPSNVNSTSIASQMVPCSQILSSASRYCHASHEIPMA
jgi:hypothetical protein